MAGSFSTCSMFFNGLKLIGISMVPVLELRASIPMGIIKMEMDWRLVYILSVIGNMIPVPFIIIYMRPIFNFFKNSKYFKKYIKWAEKRTMKKAETVMKYSAIGLFFLVAIPLPGTGAWTGSMVAALLNLRLKYAIPAITLGVITAGAIMLLGSLAVS